MTLSSFLRAAAGEASNLSALGRWRQHVSDLADRLGETAAQIVWNPVAAPEPGQYGTWAEVYAAIQGTTGLVDVYIDTSVNTAVIPVGTYDLEGRVTFTGLRSSPSVGVLELFDGAVLNDVLGFRGPLGIRTNQTLAPALTFSTPATLWLFDNAIFDNQGAVPMIDRNNQYLRINVRNGAGFDGNTPMLSAENVGTYAILGYGAPLLPDDMAADDGTGSILFQGDSTLILPTFAAFTGAVTDTRESRADRLFPSSGATVDRPTDAFTGQMYFDETLGTPIWWTGAAWVDSAGAPA